METQTYYVIKPTTHNKTKVTHGDQLELTGEQARSLINGGFIGTDKASAIRIGELAAALDKAESEIKALQAQIAKEQPEVPVKAEASKTEAGKS
ncbi:MAG: hypothetical protein AB2690_03075 [Candidatus Thiodiazotropha endolucinida]